MKNLKTIFLITMTFIYSSIQGLEPKLNAVFKRKINTETYELLKFYSNDSVEHLRYVDTYRSLTVSRNILIVKQDKSATILTPSYKEFHSEFYYKKIYLGNGIRQSWVGNKFKIGELLFDKISTKENDAPYWMEPHGYKIVNNKGIEKVIDLKALVDVIVGNSKDDMQKAKDIADYITRTVNYDYEYLKTGKTKNKQNDLKAILGGKYRLALCEGYARVYKELCNLGGLECEYVVGYSRQGFDDIGKLGNYHAWNALEIGNESYLCDVTWADGGDDYWMFVKPELMIYSHFPKDSSFQFLDVPITEKEFRTYCVAKPISGGAFHPFNVESGVVYGQKDEFVVKFKGKVSVKCEIVNADIFVFGYLGEQGVRRKSYDYKAQKCLVEFQNDTTTVRIKLNNPEIAVLLEINRAYNCYYHVFSSSEKDYYTELKENYDRHKISSLTRAFCAAITQDDEDLVNQIAPLIITEFGSFKLIKQKMGDWDGTIGDLTEVTHTNVSFDEDNQVEEETHKYWMIPIHEDFKLVCSKSNEGWVLEDILY